jgi:hypothetical protein
LAAGQEGLWPGGQREVGRDFTREFQIFILNFLAMIDIFL